MAHSFPVVFFHIFPLLCCAHVQIFLSCLFTRPSPYSFPSSMSLYIPHPPLIHIVYSSLKTHPVSCKLLVPPLIFISLPFPSLFCLPPSLECLDKSKWCDCDCSAGRLPLHVCLSASLESLTWAEGEEEGKRQRERERGESSFEQQGMAALQRVKSSVRSQSLLEPVPLFLPLSIWSQSLFPLFSHTVLLEGLFPVERPIFNSLSTVSHSFSFFHTTRPSPP